LQSYIRLLRENPNFALLWYSQMVSLLGDWFNTIALSILVSQFTGGSGLAISLFLMARFFPPLVFGPLAGVLVDRHNRQRILVLCDLLRAGVVLSFLLVNSPNQLWIIYVLTFVQFTLSALFEPAQSAIIPALVKREDLVLTNTVTNVTWSAMLAFGAIVGGSVTAILGIQFALVVDALSFVIAAYLLSRIKIDAPIAIETSVEGEKSTGGLLEGLRYIRKHPTVAAILTIKGGGSIGNIDTLMTIYATQLFILGSSGQLSLGILYCAYGIGAVMGPLALNRVNDGSISRMRNLILIGFILTSLGWILLWGGNTIAFIAFAIVIRAMGGSINWTYSSVILQKSVPDNYLGRVFAVDLTVFQLVTVISTIAHGWIIDVMNNRPYFPLLESSSSPLFRESLHLFYQPILAQNLATIALWTGFISLIPLIFWVIILPKIKRRELSPAVEFDTVTQST
jgi:MFS family permease